MEENEGTEFIFAAKLNEINLLDSPDSIFLHCREWNTRSPLDCLISKGFKHGCRTRRKVDLSVASRSKEVPDGAEVSTSINIRNRVLPQQTLDG